MTSWKSSCVPFWWKFAKKSWVTETVPECPLISSWQSSSGGDEPKSIEFLGSWHTCFKLYGFLTKFLWTEMCLSTKTFLGSSPKVLESLKKKKVLVKTWRTYTSSWVIENVLGFLKVFLWCKCICYLYFNLFYFSVRNHDNLNGIRLKTNKQTSKSNDNINDLFRDLQFFCKD